MKIHFKSTLLVQTIAQTISFLTDHSLVNVNDGIQYDQSAGILVIFMQRLEFLGYRKSRFFKWRPLFSKNRILSTLTIQNVEEVIIEKSNDLLSYHGPIIELLFGAMVEDNLINLSAPETTRGTPWHISIRVKELDLLLEDQ